MAERMGLARGFASTNRIPDVVLEKLHAKVQRQLQKQGMANRSLLEQSQFDREQKQKKLDAADLTKQTEKANQDAIARQKAAFEADVNADETLDPGVKKRALSLTALGTSEGLARAQSLVDQARSVAAKPVKVDKAAEYKDQIAELGGWEAARKKDPGLLERAAVYGVKPEEVKGPATAAGDKPVTAKELVRNALAHVSGLEKSAAAIATKMVEDGEDPEVAKATAQQIMGLDKDKRKAAIVYLKTEGRMLNPVASDSLIAAWSQPGDLEVIEPPRGEDNSLRAGMEKAGFAPQGQAVTAPAAGAESLAVGTGGKVMGKADTPIQSGTRQGAPTAEPAAGMATPEMEAKLREQQARVDRILRELEEEVGVAQ